MLLKNFILRRTYYKKFERESQNLLIKLMGKLHFLKWLCFVSLEAYLFFAPYIAIIIMDICGVQIKLSLAGHIAIMVQACVHIIICSVFVLRFRKTLYKISNTIADKIYFTFFTKGGRAISRKDFKRIRDQKHSLYKSLATRECRGFCYSTCFELCKFLKKGSIMFLAIKDLKESQTSRDYTMHVVYVNNGWAFDTTSVRQFRLKKLCNIYQVKLYKDFPYEAIYDVNYTSFINHEKKNLKSWSDDNDCSFFFDSFCNDET